MSLRTRLAASMVLLILSACNVDDVASPTSASARAADCTPSLLRADAVTIYGRVVYDHAADAHSRPARRIQVQGVADVDAPWASGTYETYTDDNGCYALEIALEHASEIDRLLVSPSSSFVDYSPDGVGDEYCNGASWDIQSGAGAWIYFFDPPVDSGWVSSKEVDVVIRPNADYQDARPADFGNLEILMTSMETVCQGEPYADFGNVRIERTTSRSGSYYSGPLFTIALAPEDRGDPFVVAHEFFHHLQYVMYGPRNDRDLVPGIEYSNRHHMIEGNLVDPRVAWFEGAASGFGYLIFERYGFGRAVYDDFYSADPIADGVYQEWQVARTVLHLIEQEGYAGFHSVYSTRFKRVPSFQTLQSFAYAYASTYDSDVLDVWMSRGGAGPESYEDAFDSRNLVGADDTGLSMYPIVQPEWRIEGPGSTTDVLTFDRSAAISFRDYNLINGYWTEDPAIGPFHSRWYRFRPESIADRSDLYEGLTILDDDANCSHDMTLVLYEYQDANLHEVTRASGCPIYIPDTEFTGADEYLVEVFADDPDEAVDCFSFFDAEACSAE